VVAAAAAAGAGAGAGAVGGGAAAAHNADLTRRALLASAAAIAPALLAAQTAFAKKVNPPGSGPSGGVGRGLHSSTFQLN
jgi:hypothetical protein